MKRLFFLFLIGGVVLTSCSEKAEPETHNINVSANFSSKTSSFAFDFWRAYEQQDSESYFLSPLSLNIALGMLLNGTEGETKDEIQKMLGFSDSEMATINNEYAEIIAKLPKVDTKVTNLVANSVWHSSVFPVEKTYLEALNKSFSASVYSENFSSQATVDKINKWAADNTNQKIKTVIEKIEPHQVLFLLNALYFKGDWTKKFDKDMTSKGTFFGATKESQKDFMYALEEFPYASTSDFKMLELPYGNEKYAFVAILPQEGTINSVIKNLTSAKWESAVKSLKKEKVEVTLPKFTVQTSKSLKSVLESLGMKKAFTTAAELGEISRTSDLFVDFVKQDTYLSVDEQGSEAAAVTSIGVGVTSVPMYPQFRCDQPFAFAIVEKTSNTIQFIGKIADL